MSAARHKFSAVQTVRDGITFSSKLEAAYFDHLTLLQIAGVVVGFLRQTPFHLPGATKYVVDFTVFWADGTITFDDPKGVLTSTYKLKLRQVRALYAWATVRALNFKGKQWVEVQA